MASAGPNIVVADARSTWRPRCVTSATTAIVSLVLAIVVVLLGFVVPAPAAAADSQLASPNAGTCGAARCFQLDGGGLSSKVAGSAFVVESCVYDSTATRAGDDVRVFLTSDGEVSATRATSETTGGLTNVGRGATGVDVGDFQVGQGFSGVYDEASGSVLALPSTRASALPENWVSARGGHGAVNARLTQAIGEPAGGRAGFTAFVEADGSLGVEWLSRSVNGLANPYVPEAMRPGILEAMARATGRTVVSR